MSNSDKYYELTLNSQNSFIFYNVLKYIASFDSINKFTMVDFDYLSEKNNIEWGIDYGSYEINYKKNLINIEYYPIGPPIGTSISVQRYEILKFKFNFEFNIINKFLVDAKKFVLPKNNSKLTIEYFKNMRWREISRLNKRNENTIFLDKNIKQKIINYIKNFLSNKTKKDYSKFGIPYKLNILFEGPPGTGKTSTIQMVASKFNLGICMLTFDKDTDDVVFQEAVHNIPKKSILVLEDIDSLFVERKKSDSNKNMITFSTVLNVLDGLSYKPGLIIFLTTNYKIRLDSALLRPGRIDKIFTLDYISDYQIRTMYDKFLPNQKNNFKKFNSKIRHIKFSTALFQSFLFQYRNSDNILDHVDDFKLLLEKHKPKLERGREKEINMYM